jgi:hypothetical protein
MLEVVPHTGESRVTFDLCTQRKRVKKRRPEKVQNLGGNGFTF